MVRDAAKMLASTMKESMCMPTGPAIRSRGRPCLEVSENQKPDLWEPNSVSGLELLMTPQVPRQPRPMDGEAVLSSDARRPSLSSTIPLVSSTIRPDLVPGPFMATYSLERR